MDKEQEIKTEIKQLEKSKKDLAQTEIVKLYLNTQSAIFNKKKELKAYHSGVMFAKFDKCHHYYIRTKINSKYKNSYGTVCILCGLDRDTRSREEDAIIMRQYILLREWRLKDKPSSRGETYYCDAKMANKVVKSIRNDNPGISDDALIKRFETTLDEMIDASTNKESAKVIAKRFKTSIKSVKDVHK